MIAAIPIDPFGTSLVLAACLGACLACLYLWRLARPADPRPSDDCPATLADYEESRRESVWALVIGVAFGVVALLAALLLYGHYHP